MAYNLESLVKIIEQIVYPHNRRHWTIDPNKKPEIESLLIKARALKRFFGNSSPLTCKKTESLESRIRDATYEAEDILELHLVGRVRSVGKAVSFTFSPSSLEIVIGEFDSVEQEIKMMMDVGSHIPAVSSSTAAASSRTDLNPKKILVGSSKDSIELKDRLTRPEAKLQIIPIVGIGGIGKTTLARYVYDDRFVASHFDTCAWVTMSQVYNSQVILLGLLERVIGKPANEMRNKKTDQLVAHLHQSLRGRRYLIVLDDVWDVKAWDGMRMFFPDDESGSRVILTTRELSVAHYARLNSSHHQMRLLNKDESWNLLCQKVFAQQACPPQLGKIGQRIANNCKGLPLAIHVIGGLLSQVNRKQESWVQVAEELSSVVTNNNERFSEILSLCYNHLPNHIKPCFLYMSVFAEDYEIRSSKLIRLWIAEGFVKPDSDRSLEEIAEMYLKSLVDRNLLFIVQRETKRKVKSYGIHDRLRDLCLKKASEEKFLALVSIHSTELTSLVPSFTSVGTLVRENILSPDFSTSGLLRVLNLMSIQLDKFPKEMLQLMELRYLDLACSSSLPSSISTLCNLQTLVFRPKSSNLRIEAMPVIFNTPQLRHIKFQDAHVVYELPDGESLVVQENLQTLSGIAVCPGFDRIIQSLPNLKKLGISFCFNFSSNIDLTCLRKLETLKIRDTFFCQHFLSLTFPRSLKELTLQNCAIPLGYVNEIVTLPNLEVLKLRDSILESLKIEVEFGQLQFLLLENLNLVKWEADETNFPRLERLIVRYCSKLEEIPSSIGEISTLEVIEVHGCSPSAVASARIIQKEQLELGNYGLRVLISGTSQ